MRARASCAPTTTRRPPGAARPEPVEGRAATNAITLDDLLTADGLRAIFQPLVELASGEVVGYEALVRGPAGTELERPDALFACAREEGRLGELDWARRTSPARWSHWTSARVPTASGASTLLSPTSAIWS